MLKMWEDLGKKSWSGEEVITKEDLNFTALFKTLEICVKTNDWEHL